MVLAPLIQDATDYVHICMRMPRWAMYAYMSVALVAHPRCMYANGTVEFALHMLYRSLMLTSIAAVYTVCSQESYEYRGRQERLSWVSYDPARPRSCIPLQLICLEKLLVLHRKFSRSLIWHSELIYCEVLGNRVFVIPIQLIDHSGL